MDSNKSGRIDLHIHSTASDGTHTPKEIVAMAARLGLTAIAITDHDTLDGCRQAFGSDIPTSLRFITGIEISVHPPEECNISESLHILGYGINPEDGPLLEALYRYQQIRNTRVHKIVDRLHQLGVPLDLQAVMDESKDGTVGRPHVATAMVKAGYAKDIHDAFDRYLGNGQKACVGKERMTCRKAFELIEGAGGVPVLAHPYLIPCDDPEHLNQLVKTLCGMGLKGLEVYYPQHSEEAVEQYVALSERFGLLATGGTDFHGDLIPDIQMGSGSGNLFVPYELFDKLISTHPTIYVR